MILISAGNFSRGMTETVLGDGGTAVGCLPRVSVAFIAGESTNSGRYAWS